MMPAFTAPSVLSSPQSGRSVDVKRSARRGVMRMTAPYPTRMERDALQLGVMSRSDSRAALIAADAALKHAAWLAELDALRTPPRAADGFDDSVDDAFRARMDVYSQMATGDFVITPSPEVTSEPDESSVPGETSVTQGTSSPPGTSAPQGTSALQGTSAAQDKTASQGTSVSVVVEPDVMDPVMPGDFAAPSVPKDDESDRRSFGASLLDAIVEGVKPIVGEKRAEKFEDFVQDKVEDVSEKVEDVVEAVEDVVEDVVEKVEDVVEDVVEVVEDVVEDVTEAVEDVVEAVEDTVENVVGAVTVAKKEEEKPKASPELIELVSSGKIKSLTVTKLRRLLSNNGLKTSGRKTELIARLTSFANSS